MANTTWSTTDHSTSYTLSGGNLTVTSSGGGANGRAADRQVAGKFYWEITANTIASTNTGFGIANANALIGFAFNAGNGVNACVAWKSSAIYLNGSSTGISIGTISNGNLVCFALDMDNRRFWVRVGAAGNWNGNAANNPATNVGGIDVSSIVGGAFPAYPLCTFGNIAEQITANFGDTAFTGAVPAGFTSGFTAGATIDTNMLTTQSLVEEWASGAPAMQLTQAVVEEWGSVATYSPYTTWSLSDTTTGIAVTNGGLTATATTIGQTSVRTVDRLITGKFYWEYTNVNNSNSSYGLANQSAAIGNIFGQNGSTPNTVVMTPGAGQLYVNGVSSGISVGAVANGGFTGWALDLPNQLLWVRNGASGNWNGSGTANPATGVGGVSITSVFSAGIPAYGLMSANNGPGASVTANFGASAFAGTVPAGFTSGFPSGAVIPVNTIATQLVADTWAVPPAPAVQLTNISIEQWAQVDTTNPQAVATLIALDEWATVAMAGTVVPGGGGPMISLLM